MEKYKTMIVTGVITGKKYEKKVMTKEFALSLQHADRGKLTNKQDTIVRRQAYRNAEDRAWLTQNIAHYNSKEHTLAVMNHLLPKRLPARFGGYRN